MSRFLLLLISLLPSAALWAQPILLTEQIRNKIEHVANQKQWHHLLHYRLHPYTFRWQSQNDSETFFLSPIGKQSPQAELEADLQAFLIKAPTDNQSAQCRFPARYHWLKSQFPELDFDDQLCSELEQWQSELNAHYLTIIFPTSHINSPSSMYGHTLVRLDKADEKQSKLLSYSVNFAANADPKDNELVFSWKGLTGGYPGVVSVLPYYAKTNEYSHFEYRDIWEYRLNLTPDEVAQFVRHVWETKDSYFDYYFFDENCSYRLLALLDASSERLDLAQAFHFTALPVDTVRALEEAQLIEKAEFRASAASEMEHKAAQSSEEVIAVAKQLVETSLPIDELIDDLSLQDQVRALELSHDYARYLSIKKKQASPELRKRTLALLSARAKKTQPAQYQPLSTPKYRDDQGHDSGRVHLFYGMSYDQQAHQNRTYWDLGWRAAFHDVMDPPQGFAQGAQIEMGRLAVRLWESGHYRLQELAVLDILSLSEQTQFQQPIAWSVATGWQREIGQEAPLYAYLNAGAGRTWKTSAGRFYTLLDTQLAVDNEFIKGYQLKLGPRLGWLWQSPEWQAQIEARAHPLALGDERQSAKLQAQLGWQWQKNGQLKLSGEYGWQEAKANRPEIKAYEIQAGVQWYF